MKQMSSLCLHEYPNVDYHFRNKLDYLCFDSVLAHNEFHVLFVNFLISDFQNRTNNLGRWLN